MARVDFDEVKRASLASIENLLFRWYPLGVINGHEFMIGSLQGEAGKSLSVNINNGKWGDFAQGITGGDLIDLYVQKTGLPVVDACREIMEQLAMEPAPRPENASPARKKKPKAVEWHDQMPPPADKPPPVAHFKYGKPDHVAIVRNQDGEMMHVIHRFEASELTGGKKQIVPWTYGLAVFEDGTRSEKWHAMAPNAPRPLYGLPIPPGSKVLLVEGEKKRDAAARLLAGTGWHPVSWPNGFQGMGHADWNALRGFAVASWRDNDEPGLKASYAQANALRGIAADFRIVDLPGDLPPKWDLWDAEQDGWTTNDVLAVLDPDAISHPPEDDRVPDQPARAPQDADAWPFRCLGHDQGRYFFLPTGTGQVVALTARDLHGAASLAALARLSWWEGAFPQKRGGFDVHAAGDALLRASERVGIYDGERLRGRGVWLDEGRTVLHLGDRVLSGNVATAPAKFESDMIYEAARRLDVTVAAPATKREAAGLIQLCCAVSWEDPERDGRILAGWLVVALACGAMPWRPHIWITSEGGGGKSWVLRRIVKAALGPIALNVQGNTSEAGIRGKLRTDARPVVFDEAETQDEDGRRRIQGVLNLARQASSEDGAEVLKGTRDGGSTSYLIRSAFAFSSINLGMTQAADESRTVPLNITPLTDPVASADHFARLKAILATVMTPEFPARLLARTIDLVPVIRANAEALALAIARDGVSQRTGDTLGVILAGALSLTSDKVLTPEEADQFVAEREWVRKKAHDAEAKPEWKRAIMRLMQHDMRFQGHNGHLAMLKVGELIAALRPGPGDEKRVPSGEAENTLRGAGMRVMDTKEGVMLMIANGSEVAAGAFANTPWATAWRATLERAPRGKRSVPTRFTRYMQDRAVAIPLEHALDDGA